MARKPVFDKRRVITLLNAIANLHHGDLFTVLKLEETTSMREFGNNDVFELTNEGKILIKPGSPPSPKSSKHKARSGEDLARILEDRLMSILSVGEASSLFSRKKRSMAKKELGSRVFLQSDV